VDVALQVRSKADNSVKELKIVVNGSRLLVGRGPECAVLLDGQGISRQHLGIDAEESSLFLTDLSSNGTWLNGKRLPQNRRSKVGNSDVVEVPDYEIRILAVGGAAGRTAVPSNVKESNPTESQATAPSNSFLGSLTLLEKFVLLLAVLAAALCCFYFLS
jgi:pSer/pThr/pTyr-binding forkhead associated (FHA) protein